MTPPPLSEIERQLRRRLTYPYHWGGRQNDRRDRATDFIYTILDFDQLLAAIDVRFRRSRDFEAWRNYALNRWYNFWSAQAVERLFAQQPGVRPHPDRHNRLVDFTLQGIPFDHKTTIFPRHFGHDLAYARAHPDHLLQWLYTSQSRERRYHAGNRLFLILHRGDGEHWRLKAEIGWLETIIRIYVHHFDPTRLHRLNLPSGDHPLCDLLWAIRE